MSQEVADEGKFARVFAPQPKDVVFPPHHLAEDEHDGDGGETDEEEEGICLLHHVQPLLVAEDLETGKEEGNHSHAVLRTFYFCLNQALCNLHAGSHLGQSKMSW